MGEEKESEKNGWDRESPIQTPDFCIGSTDKLEGGSLWDVPL